MNTTSHDSGSVEGWTSAPNLRGTFDIIWSCVQTIFLCAWVSICVNIPAPDDGSFELVRDKFHFLILTFLAPELVFVLAYAQLESARASVALFRAGGYKDWTVTHGFYADMGGIAVTPRGWKRFPVDARQLHYLVTHGYVDYPAIPIQDIKRGGKIDGLGRLVTLAQTLYFTGTILARFAQRLEITTIELTTLGLVICTIATTDAGSEANTTYRDTQMDFVSAGKWAGSVIWPFYVNVLRRSGLFPPKHTARPLQKFSSFTFLKPSSRLSKVVSISLGLLYTAIFFAAWNFYFPTSTERRLWRISTAVQCGLSGFVGIFEVMFHTAVEVQEPVRESSCQRELHDVEKVSSDNTRRRLRSVWNKPINNSVGKHPFYDVPLGSLLVTTPLCAVYCICRCYILVEDLAGLRSVPASVYQTVDWTQYWPTFLATGAALEKICPIRY